MWQWIAGLWHSNWRNKAMLIGSALIFLTALIVVPWAVITRQGDEGFLRIDGQPIGWHAGALPLGCMAHPDVTQADLELYKRAASEINDRVGTRLVFPVCQPWVVNTPFPKQPVRGQILLYTGTSEDELGADSVAYSTTVETPWNLHPGGVTHIYMHRDTPLDIYGVQLWIEPEYRKNYAVWLHEILHALGMDHDRARDSIMWPTIQERPGKLGGQDASRLWQRYGGTEP